MIGSRGGRLCLCCCGKEVLLAGTNFAVFLGRGCANTTDTNFIFLLLFEKILNFPLAYFKFFYIFVS
ncbi:hypothetical protein D9V84_08480 [Bacteroidetes/Chlorobi group bacterium Naka2016]|jgi:hypothetical protein|nr:MAG: hypothetical protein D9V84_08480 [Bacteroidetes/Chlorobi group bacterium Naka2016]